MALGLGQGSGLRIEALPTLAMPFLGAIVDVDKACGSDNAFGLGRAVFRCVDAHYDAAAPQGFAVAMDILTGGALLLQTSE